MRCEELMKKNVQCINPTENVQAAARLMSEKNVGFLPVCGPDKRVIGAVTDRDIAIRVVAQALNAELTPIRDIMTKEIISVKPSDDVSLAEKLMAERRKSRMLVIGDDGMVAGVISLSDIIQSESAGAFAAMRGVTSRESRVMH